jgi:serine protease Do
MEKGCHFPALVPFAAPDGVMAVTRLHRIRANRSSGLRDRHDTDGHRVDAMTTGRIVPSAPLWARQRRAMRPLALGALAMALTVATSARAGDVVGTTEPLLKAKPAVVLVVTEVSIGVRLVCPNGSPKRVAVAPSQEHGTGFLITPDGYIVTNGHVVQAYHDPDDREVRQTAVREAIAQACVDPTSAKDRRERALTLLYPKVAPGAEVEVAKTLRVVLSNRETFVAEVKAYSSPLAPRSGKQATGRTVPAQESGKDVAILKIDARNLPTLALGDSDRVELGQPLQILGFPGVVLYHELLDKRSAVEASVTSGRVSSLKRDARGAPVIQTDAAASWGNSGGPAINERGEVVGILTFISVTADETQSVQGFNFLVPANIVREFARGAGVSLEAPSPFNAVWHEAVTKYVQGDWAGAQHALDAAARLVPNLADVQRLQAEVQLRLLQSPRGLSPVAIGGIAAAVLAATAAGWWGWRRRGRRRAGATRTVVQEPRAVAAPAPSRPVPVRVSAMELAKVMEQRPDLAIVDLREPPSYAASAVQAKGAIHGQEEEILQTCSTWPRDRGIILYCDSPGEAVSMRAAERLMMEGYTRVAVLSGGFAAWLSASLPLERTAHGREMEAPAPKAIPAPESAAHSILDEAVGVDLSVGVKGAGPYFNARATRLGLHGLSLELPHAVTVGQPLRLTIFLQGEPLDVTGHVVSVGSTSSPKQRTEAEITFEPLGEEQRVILEGFILAHRTRSHS